MTGKSQLQSRDPSAERRASGAGKPDSLKFCDCTRNTPTYVPAANGICVLAIASAGCAPSGTAAWQLISMPLPTTQPVPTGVHGDSSGAGGALGCAGAAGGGTARLSSYVACTVHMPPSTLDVFHSQKPSACGVACGFHNKLFQMSQILCTCYTSFRHHKQKTNHLLL